MARELPLNHGALTWNDRRLDGRRKEVDRAIGNAMGGRARSGLDASYETMKARRDNPANNPQTKTLANRAMVNLDQLRSNPDIKDSPTTINNVARNIGQVFESGVQRGIDEGGGVPGAGWYFDHRRNIDEVVDPAANLTPRQATAMGALASAGKTPEDERASIGGVSELVGRRADAQVGDRRVRDLPAPEIARIAAGAATESAHQAGRSQSARRDLPDMDPDTFDAFRRSGRAHEKNVEGEVQIARGERSPNEVFDPVTRPKTANYGEMGAQSNPGSVVETDYREVAGHYRDIKAGTQTANQGMMLFSQDKPGEREYALRQDSPTAIDTWMLAIGSGQPAQQPRPGRKAMPTAKRLTDKDHPLDPTGPTKAELGVADLRDASISSVNLVSAHHNEAIQRYSRGVGAISHDQHGQDVNLPSSLIQEVSWTEGRKQANADPEWNARNRASDADARASARAQAAAEKQFPQPKLFEPASHASAPTRSQRRKAR